MQSLASLYLPSWSVSITEWIGQDNPFRTIFIINQEESHSFSLFTVIVVDMIIWLLRNKKWSIGRPAMDSLAIYNIPDTFQLPNLTKTYVHI